MIDQQLFIRRLYDETYTLLVEARNYFSFRDVAQSPSAAKTPQDRLFVNYQAMRFTSRMTQAMAWLLAQRAAHAGELSPDEAQGGAYSLSGEPVCTETEGHDDARLPEGLRRLLRQSHALYHRVWRLDQSARQKADKLH